MAAPAKILRPETMALLSLILLGEDLIAVGKAVGLQKETEDQCSVGGNRLVLIAGRAPYELSRPAHALVVLERPFEHIGLLKRSVLMQRNHGARRQLEQRRGAALVVGVAP